MIAADRDEQLVHVPNATESAPPAARGSGVRRSELPAPPSNDLVGYGDAALGEKILDIVQAQAEPMVQPHGVADDLGWKAVASIRGLHRPIVGDHH